MDIVVSKEGLIMIDAIGDYHTRNGSIVRVNAISDGPETFKVKGSLYRVYRGKLRTRGYYIWTLDGRYKAVGESELDIIGKVELPHVPV